MQLSIGIGSNYFNPQIYLITTDEIPFLAPKFTHSSLKITHLLSAQISLHLPKFAQLVPQNVTIRHQKFIHYIFSADIW